MVTLQRSWQALEQTAKLRQQGAELLLATSGELPKGSRGKDIQVETTMGDLLAALTGDLASQQRHSGHDEADGSRTSVAARAGGRSRWAKG